MFCLNDSVSAYLHSFDLYAGRDGVPRRGLARDVVMKLLTLSGAIGANRILFCDSYYGSVRLAVTLAMYYGVLMVACVRTRNSKTGTVRDPDSFPFNVPQGSATDRVERGWLRRAVRTVRKGRGVVRVVAYLWKDNKFVTMISTAWTGVRSFADTVHRSVAKGFEKVDLQAFPAVIQYQHDGMNGTDRFDRLVADRSCSFRTRKWTSRVFFWLVDAVSANMWIICKILPKFKHWTAAHSHHGGPRSYFQYRLAEMVMENGVAEARDRMLRKQVNPVLAAAGKDFFEHDNTFFLPRKSGPKPTRRSFHAADHERVRVHSDRCQVCVRMWGVVTRDDRRSQEFKDAVASTCMRCEACGVRICDSCHRERVWDHDLGDLREAARSKFSSWQKYLHAHPRRPHQGRS